MSDRKRSINSVPQRRLSPARPVIPACLAYFHSPQKERKAHGSYFPLHHGEIKAIVLCPRNFCSVFFFFLRLSSGPHCLRNRTAWGGRDRAPALCGAIHANEPAHSASVKEPPRGPRPFCRLAGGHGNIRGAAKLSRTAARLPVGPANAKCPHNFSGIFLSV